MNTATMRVPVTTGGDARVLSSDVRDSCASDIVDLGRHVGADLKTGIVLLNFGGPWTLADVKPFLYRLFANPAVLVGVPAPFRQLVAYAISQIKGRESIKWYEAIGGGSPQLKWTVAQAAGLSRLFDDSMVRIEIGMRTAEPSIESALAKLRDWGAKRLILLPLFPQFSTTTTGTCFEAAESSLRRMKWNPFIHEVTQWPDDPGYIGLLRKTIDDAIAGIAGVSPAGTGIAGVSPAGSANLESNPNNSQLHILFSAHSLPMKIVKGGDPYPQHVEQTIAAVTKDLNYPWSLSYQSRNGKMPWLEPYTEDEIKRLGHEGVRRLVVAPISFVSDHIETLYELDQLYKQIAIDSGITEYYRARTFNDDPEFPRVLRSILEEAGV